MQWKMQIGCMKGQGGSARLIDASTLMWLNGYFVNIWTTNTASHGGRQIWLSFYSCWGTKATKSPSMNARILSNPHARQKRNEKKALDRVKKKVELEWDELQARVQQME
jgi:hypothetical protein